MPDSIEAMADDAYTFITALGFDKIDVFSFSLGGFIAQALVVKHPELVRKFVLTGTGPKGGKDIDKVAGTTYRDMLRATLTRSDPKEFLFFNRNATGKPAARAFVNRLKERTADHDAKIKVQAFQTQVNDPGLKVPGLHTRSCYLQLFSPDAAAAPPRQPRSVRQRATWAGPVGEFVQLPGTQVFLTM
ncbi:alpha/beta hydrolase [Streptomyces sp. NBC_01003]|uniref:alpha/beta hydrolase n=1 Tax=Streptomyces sp. NBC_01003 TaxID=2903714 RepID=UPI0038694D82|nr:alpha/beta hydrolase [Streptomyces sp. NBC_01003]